MSAQLNRGLLWGQLLTGLETLRHHAEMARRSNSLLSADDRKRLQDVSDMLLGIEQRAWDAFQKQGRGKK